MDAIKLKSLMILNKKNQAKMAAEIGISKVSFSNKMRGKTPFSMKEVGKIAEVLNLTESEAVEIFLKEDAKQNG